MLARLALVTCAFGLFLAAGCGPAKLNESKTLSLEPGDPKALDLPAQPKPQKITVEYSATEEVTVIVIKEADAKGPDGLLNADVKVNRDKALASKTGKGETFSVDVPENTAVRVIFFVKKKTDVTVKLTNK